MDVPIPVPTDAKSVAVAASAILMAAAGGEIDLGEAKALSDLIELAHRAHKDAEHALMFDALGVDLQG